MDVSWRLLYLLEMGRKRKKLGIIIKIEDLGMKKDLYLENTNKTIKKKNSDRRNKDTIIILKFMTYISPSFNLHFMISTFLIEMSKITMAIEITRFEGETTA